MANGPTLSNQLFDPEVIASVVESAAVSNLPLTKFAKVDTTLQGTKGSTIIVPKYNYIGRSPRLNETDVIQPKALTLSTAEVVIREAGDAIGFTDTALAVSYGDPLGEALYQLGVGISDRVEYDLLEAAVAAPLTMALDNPNEMNWKAFVAGFTKFGDRGFNDLAGVVMTTDAFAHIMVDPTFGGDQNAKGKGVTDGTFVTVAGAPILVSDTIKDVDPTVACIVLKKDALGLYWKTLPTVETERVALARVTNLVISSIYAVNVTNEAGVVVVRNP